MFKSPVQGKKQSIACLEQSRNIHFQLNEGSKLRGEQAPLRVGVYRKMLQQPPNIAYLRHTHEKKT